jgi:hypothetical protein
MTNAWNDFNDARQNANLIPKGTIAKVRLTIRPGGFSDPAQGWNGGYARRGSTGAVFLDVEYVVLEGQYARRRIWSMIGLYSPKGPDWGNMGRSFVRGMLNSARGLSDKDNSPEAQNARRISGFADLDGIEFVARIDVGTDSNGEEKNDIRQAVNLADIVGKQTIWLPAGAMTARATNGASSSTEELVTNDVMVGYWAFDAAVSEAVQAMIRMPKGWNEGTLEVEFLWKHPATTTSFGVKWGVRARAISNDDAVDAAWGTEQEVADTGGTTADLYTTAMTAALTVGSTPAAGDLVAFEFYRDPADAADTMTVDAHLIGVTIVYTTDAARDN